MHPGAWFAWVAGAGVVAIATTNPFYLAPLFVAAWAVHSRKGVDGPAARSFRTFALFAAVAVVARTVLVVFSPPLSWNGVAYAALEGLRLGTLLVLFGTFNSVTDPFRVLRLAPRRWHEPALAAALALSIAPRTMEAAAKVRESQRLRGIEIKSWRTLPALAVPVLATGMEDAVTLAESMDARGHGSGRRTRYRPDRFGRSAGLTVALAVAGAAAVVALAVRGEGALTVSTYPLRWPGAEVLPLLASFAFAAPAFLPADPVERKVA
ncbi:MAG TPA: energy-coupling factor transporter transmembrane component T [Actinomycetota bacterium]|nr:energy-coupling factor transporter transmembrane component T [Actinomycetota bacterium]